MDERIEKLACKLAEQFGDWRNWDTAKSVCDTPSGNEPEEERDYWRGIASVAFSAGREAMREDAARVADEIADCDCNEAMRIATAIRALPGKEE